MDVKYAPAKQQPCGRFSFFFSGADAVRPEGERKFSLAGTSEKTTPSNKYWTSDKKKEGLKIASSWIRVYRGSREGPYSPPH